MFEEIALQGGRLTAGVVCINDTVRRPWSNHSEFSAELLKFIQWRVFVCAPEYLGRTIKGERCFDAFPEGCQPNGGGLTTSKLSRPRNC